MSVVIPLGRAIAEPVRTCAGADHVLQLKRPGVIHKNNRTYILRNGTVEQLGSSGKQFGIDRLEQELGRNRSASLQMSIDLSLEAVLNSSVDGRTDDDISMLEIEIY